MVVFSGLAVAIVGLAGWASAVGVLRFAAGISREGSIVAMLLEKDVSAPLRSFLRSWYTTVEVIGSMLTGREVLVEEETRSRYPCVEKDNSCL